MSPPLKLPMPVVPDDRPEAFIAGALAGQSTPQVDDGHDHAAQIDHALDVTWGALAMRVGGS